MNCILRDRVESFDPEAASRRRGEAKRAPGEFREFGLSREVVAGPAFHPAHQVEFVVQHSYTSLVPFLEAERVSMVERRRQATLIPTEDDRPVLVMTVASSDPGIHEEIASPDVSLDKLGLLDDPEYIKGANRETPSRQNVAALSASVSSALLAQFVSLTAHPGRRGVPAPLRYILSSHTLEHSTATSGPYCPYENATTLGDRRTPIAERRDDWRITVAARATTKHSLRLRVAAWVERLARRTIDRIVD